MAKKTTKNKTKGATTQRASTKGDRIDPRKKLLARIAGNVAAAIVQAPSPSVSSSEKIAEVAVDIAEQILRKVGVIPTVGDPAAAAPGQAAA